MTVYESLQAALQSRYTQIARSSTDSFDANVRYFFQWADSAPILASILSFVSRSDPYLDPAEWWEGPSHGRNIHWPTTEAGRAKVVLWKLRRIAAGSEPGYQAAWQLANDEDANEAIRSFCHDAVGPLFDYLQLQLSPQNNLIHLLERYRRRVTWFEQSRLWEMYQQDTRNGERNYEKDLRRFLFEEGIDYPLSEPASPSGMVDVLAHPDSDSPLACEVKLFDGRQYGISYLAKGLQQAFRYTQDFGYSEGYLVIFNLSDRPIQLPSDDLEREWPPRLHLAGVTIFVVIVQAKPRRVASRAGSARPIEVLRGDLVPAESNDPGAARVPREDE